MTKDMFKDWKKYLAEFMGTAILVFIACGVAAYTQGDLVPTALAFGLTLVALCYTIGDVSGAHVNPAVSFGMYVNNKMSGKDFGFYVLSQFLGAAFGGALLFLVAKIAGIDAPLVMGTNFYEDGVFFELGLGAQVAGALLIEIILTFVFVFTIIGVTRKNANKYTAGLVIGLTLALVHLLGIPFTGTSVNPARSLGVAIFGGVDAIKQVWLFIVAPMLGAALAAAMSRVIYGREEVVDNIIEAEENKKQK
jgi:aquaporin Z